MATGTLKVIVTDSKAGLPFVGATISVYNSTGPGGVGNSAASLTNANGLATFPNLNTGTFYITMNNMRVGKTYSVPGFYQNTLNYVLGSAQVSDNSTSTINLSITQPTLDNPNGSVTEIQGSQPTPPPSPPGGGISTTPPPSSSFPTTPTSLNPIDWINWIGQILQWMVTQVWSALANAYAGLQAAAWAALPTWVKIDIRAGLDFLSNVNLFFTDPGTFYRKHSAAIWQEGSPSPMALQATNAQAFMKNQTTNPGAPGDLGYDIGANIQNAIKSGAEALANHFSASVPYASALTEAYNVSDEAALAVLSATVANVLIECIPGWNFTGISFLTGAILDTFGVGAYTNDVYRRRYEANIGRQLDLVFNETYLNLIPSIGELERLINVGKITPSDWITYAQRATGITGEWLDKSRLAKHQVPTIPDMIVWNLRHPDQTFDITSNGDLLEANMTDYAKYFLERQYSDPSLIAIRTLAPLGILQDGDFKSFLTRRGYRSDLLPGQTISDYDAMFKYLHSLKEPALEKTALASKQKLYLSGQATEAELQTAASQVYSDQTQLNLFMQAAKDDLALKTLRPKHFTYTLLIKMAEAGIDTTAFIDTDLSATGLDQSHIAALKQYITTTVQANQASSSASNASTTS